MHRLIAPLLVLALTGSTTLPVHGLLVTDLEEQMLALRETTRSMFYHGFDSYMRAAYPRDELCPLTCAGKDTWGPFALTLVDSLDTLVVMGNYTLFRTSVESVSRILDFNIDKNVSVFETNIRVLGGLLSAHMLAEDMSGQRLWSHPEAPYVRALSDWRYDGRLLELAQDLGNRLLPAFGTPTCMPYGTVNLRHGVPPRETTITSLAGAGTQLIEFAVLSRVTKDPRYESVARCAMRALWARRSPLDLLGNHIDVFKGQWTLLDAGIGPNQDSFYEYLLKSYALFGVEEDMEMFQDVYRGAVAYMKQNDWYTDVNMNTGQTSLPWFTALGAFWPGLQVLYGDASAASRTMHSFRTIWRSFGFVPEAYDLATNQVHPRLVAYFLRPEMAESLMYLFEATRDPVWIFMGWEMVESMEEVTWTPCGYAVVNNVTSHELGDRMESFFLSETLKYLYLLFDKEHFIHRGQYVFNTEGHFFPISALLQTPHWQHQAKAPSQQKPNQPATAAAAEGEQEGGEGRGGDPSSTQSASAGPLHGEFLSPKHRWTCPRQGFHTITSVHGLCLDNPEPLGPASKPKATRAGAPQAEARSRAQRQAEAAASTGDTTGGSGHGQEIEPGANPASTLIEKLQTNLVGQVGDAAVDGAIPVVLAGAGAGLETPIPQSLISQITETLKQSFNIPIESMIKNAKAKFNLAGASTAQPADPLKSLRESCFTHTKDFWSYEVCFARSVRQFHKDGDHISAEHLIGLRHTADAVVRAKTLQQVQRIVDGASLDIAEGEKELVHVALQQLQGRYTDPSKYLIHLHTGGDECETGTQEGRVQRTAWVVYVCNSSLTGMSVLFSVVEPRPCAYVITISSRLVCEIA